MKKLSHAVIPLALIATLSGCQQLRPADASQPLDCAALQAVIAAEANHFQPIIDKRESTKFGYVWRANTHAFGDACTLMGTTDKPSRYLCTLPGRPEQALAQLNQEVAACVGSQWVATPLELGTRYAKPDSSIIVFVGHTDEDAAKNKSYGLLVRRLQ